MISEKALRDFMTKVPEHILVVVDEAYYEYAKVLLLQEYPDSIRMNYSNVLTLRTFSKAYGLAGMRVGYAMGSCRFDRTSNASEVDFRTFELGASGWRRSTRRC